MLQSIECYNQPVLWPRRLALSVWAVFAIAATWAYLRITHLPISAAVFRYLLASTFLIQVGAGYLLVNRSRYRNLRDAIRLGFLFGVAPAGAWLLLVLLPSFYLHREWFKGEDIREQFLFSVAVLAGTVAGPVLTYVAGLQAPIQVQPPSLSSGNLLFRSATGYFASCCAWAALGMFLWPEPFRKDYFFMLLSFISSAMGLVCMGGIIGLTALMNLVPIRGRILTLLAGVAAVILPVLVGLPIVVVAVGFWVPGYAFIALFFLTLPAFIVGGALWSLLIGGWRAEFVQGHPRGTA